jgi:hypothetical protein
MNAGEKYELYRVGFKHGATKRAASSRLRAHDSYDQGYRDGERAYAKALSTFARKCGVKRVGAP